MPQLSIQSKGCFSMSDEGFLFASQWLVALCRFQEGRTESFEYGRYGNPTVDTVEQKIR